MGPLEGLLSGRLGGLRRKDIGREGLMGPLEGLLSGRLGGLRRKDIGREGSMGPRGGPVLLGELKKMEQEAL
uniref:Uncharacterized protein n=1 Tax=Arcella intermedia TaxID=1963864 RepID=A0A6B2LVU5_9EUKA